MKNSRAGYAGLAAAFGLIWVPARADDVSCKRCEQEAGVTAAECKSVCETERGHGEADLRRDPGDADVYRGHGNAEGIQKRPNFKGSPKLDLPKLD